MEQLNRREGTSSSSSSSSPTEDTEFDFKSKQQNDFRKGISVKYKLLAVLFATCIFGVLTDDWLLERYLRDSMPIGGNPKADPFWFHLMFHAASSKQDLGVAFKSNNISVHVDKMCQVPRLESTEIPPYVTCKRPQPISGSCEIADKVFHSEPTPTCDHQKTHTICQIQTNENGYFANCSNHVCNNSISLGVINSFNGALSWMQMQNIATLQITIGNLLKKNESNGNYGFCFLKCTLEDDTVASQLLLTPKHFTRNDCSTGKNTCEDEININIIWLDSTSHSHFYRSMPKTVKALRTIKSTKRAHLFNYNLMQSMKGGTFVNTVAFTSGRILPRSLLLKSHGSIGNLLNLFKSGGYHVTWIDDLCWNWSIEKCACGIPKFLGVALDKTKSATNAWKDIKKTLMTKGIDQIDISLSNCEIMKANNITDPFHVSKGGVAICYNGFYQTHYILSSLEMLQKQLHSVKRPFVHYLDLNLGHEASGRRIQTLDGSLAKFVTFLSLQKNTLTLMFGDHGNKYGTYVKTSKESKIEMAHPVLFVLASYNLQTKLGKDRMEALNINQDRLVNILDLRHTLLALAPVAVPNKKIDIDRRFDVHPDGLFYQISPKRSCKTMGIPLEAGKCICQQGQISQKTSNSTRVLVLANFALGELNNMIQEQFISANSHSLSGFGSCNRLVGEWITNVQETLNENVTVTEMDIHVPAGSKAPQTEDAFSVVVQVTTNTPNAPSIKLVHYERITTYAVYDGCRDDGVDGSLCICSPPKKPEYIYWHLNPPIVFGYMTTVVSLNTHLYIHERRTPHGVIVETSCDCMDTLYMIVVDVVRQENVVSSKTMPLMINVSSGRMLFVNAFVQMNHLRKWKLEYDIKFRQQP